MLSLVDPVFVPRMVHVVDAIPRNATGKVSAEHLALLLRSVQQAGPGQPKRAGIT
jgi:acyl-coenzyme A synthetase/AMP-(fatty) acid ligase